jgi:triacylglycerol lipase
MPVDPLKLKHPVVLVHGLGARSAYGPFEYFYGLPKLLRDAGNTVFSAKLTPWHTIEWRARELKEQLDQAFPQTQVNLIGHSMGGLDSRYATSALGLGERVASVTTIGTPNRGSVMGDIATGLLPNVAFVAVNHLLKSLEYSSEGFRQITQKHVSEVLAPKMPNVPGVAYFSATSAIPDPFMKYSLPVFWIPNRILRKYEGDNDGFVSVQSASWGEHICTYRGDHYGQIGQFLGRSRGLDYLSFYNEIFGRLHREGM